jgi:hypothetical protein
VAVAPTITTALGSEGKPLDPSSNLVLSVSEHVRAVAGKSIVITDQGGLLDSDEYRGYRGTDSGDGGTHSFTIPADDPLRISIVGSGSSTKIVINPDVLFDLDLSSNYKLTVPAGAFVGTDSQLGTGELSVDFSTVVPFSGSRTEIEKAQRSWTMDGQTGALVSGRRWVDIEGRGVGLGGKDPTNNKSPPASNPGATVWLDAGKRAAGDSEDNYVFVFRDASPDGFSTQTSGVATTTDFNVLLQNFGAGDRIYIDDQYNNAAAINKPDKFAFLQGNGSPITDSNPYPLFWGLVMGGTGTDGDPQLYVSLAGVVTQGQGLAAMNTALGLTGIGDSTVILGG